MICTIYLLTNTINNKVYVGQTWNSMYDRMGKTGGKYKNSPYIYNAIKKYGVENFKYSALAYCESQISADKTENFYIIKYDSRNPNIGYNIKEGGSHGKHTEESIKAISNTLQKIADLWSPEERIRRAAPVSGWWRGKERGPQTEERKENVSQKLKDWHKNNEHPMKGKHQPESAKLKMSIALKGKKQSKETVEKRVKTRLSKRDVEKDKKIIEAYLSGRNVRDIQEEFQEKHIYRILKRNNITLLNNFKKWEGKSHLEKTITKMSDKRKDYWVNWRKINK